VYRYITESSHAFGPSYFIGPSNVRVLHFFRGSPSAEGGQRGNDARARCQRAPCPRSSKCAALALNARPQLASSPSPTSPSPPLPRSRSPSLALALAQHAPPSPSVLPARVWWALGSPDTSEPSFSRKFKPQVHRRRSIEAPFKLYFIGCRTTLPHGEGILLLETLRKIERLLGDNILPDSVALFRADRTLTDIEMSDS